MFASTHLPELLSALGDLAAVLGSLSPFALITYAASRGPREDDAS